MIARIAAYLVGAIVTGYVGLRLFVWFYDYFTFTWWINGWRF